MKAERKRTKGKSTKGKRTKGKRTKGKRETAGEKPGPKPYKQPESEAQAFREIVVWAATVAGTFFHGGILDPKTGARGKSTKGKSTKGKSTKGKEPEARLRDKLMDVHKILYHVNRTWFFDERRNRLRRDTIREVEKGRTARQGTVCKGTGRRSDLDGPKAAALEEVGRALGMTGRTVREIMRLPGLSPDRLTGDKWFVRRFDPDDPRRNYWFLVELVDLLGYSHELQEVLIHILSPDPLPVEPGGTLDRICTEADRAKLSPESLRHLAFCLMPTLPDSPDDPISRLL